MTPDAPRTAAGRLLLATGLTFHSGRRLADYPQMIVDIEAEAAQPAASGLRGTNPVDMRNLLLLAEAAGDEYANRKGPILPHMERLQRAVDLLRPHYPPAAAAYADSGEPR